MKTEDKIEHFLYYFVWLVVVPAIVLGFVGSILWPGQRISISSVLSRGFGIFVVLGAVYFIIDRFRGRG